MNLLDVENLSYSYNGKQFALQNVSFSIANQGVVGLLGANGAGKSTLMNLVCGILQPTSGKITIRQHSILQDRIAYLQNIGFLPQQPPLYTELTVKEYLTHVADFKGVSRKDVKKAVGKAMEKCDLLHFQNRLIRNLSGGYQQRVGIAQAIIHTPPIIILDEPTNGLDPHQIIEIRELVCEISKETLVLLSTHIISEIEKMSDRILILEDGKLIVDNSLSELRNLLHSNQIEIVLKEEAEGLSILEENGFLIQKKIANKLLIDSEKVNINKVLQCCLQHNLKVESIYPKQTSIEEVYHSLRKKIK